MKEKIIIVNENDKIIDFVERDTKEGGIYRVSALWITNSRGEILLAKRVMTKSHEPGKWGPAVAGTNEEGETYESNILKEAEEELGLCGIKLKKFKKVRVSHKYHFFCQWFTLKMDKSAEEFKLQKTEVDKVKWWTKEELSEKISEHPEEFTTSMPSYVNLFI